MFDALPTADELQAHVRALAGDPRVSVTRVGTSRGGQPLELVSLGEGRRNALIVGVPHPNEPAGAVTVMRMIRLLLDDPAQQRGYRWHFIPAIDPDGLRLNEGWLKQRTIRGYLENFFRPALHRQPETTFPIDIPDCRFTASTPENEAWQRAFDLTRPELHASLHHCDFGGVFHSLSRALPAAIAGLQAAARRTGLGLLEHEHDVMDGEHFAPAITGYPSVPELIASAKASGASWAYPWKYGEMSPGYGETRFGTFTLVAEAAIWDAPTLHDESSSGVTVDQQRTLLDRIGARAQQLARHHLADLARAATTADELECLWALEHGLPMIPASPPAAAAAAETDERLLTCREFDLRHTEHALFSLRTYGLMLRLADLLLARDAGCMAAASARHDARTALHEELDVIEARTRFAPVALPVVTGFQMQSIFACADALAAEVKPPQRHDHG